jgi:hypothetical protein
MPALLLTDFIQRSFDAAPKRAAAAPACRRKSRGICLKLVATFLYMPGGSLYSFARRSSLDGCV